MTTFARIDRGPAGPAFVRVDGDGLALLRAAPWIDAALTNTDTNTKIPSKGARFLSPVAPSKIICVGRNYRAHAAELGNEAPPEPLLFFKPPSAVIGPGESILLPHQSNRIDHEAELGVVIGARCRRVPEDRALDFVFGYTCVNDVTARDLQKKDGQWARAKGFDSFCPAGPVIVTDLDPASARVRCRVAGAVRQDGNTRDMMFPVAQIIAYISSIMTLEPGDLIATGTPHGVGPLAPGDTVEVEIDGIGILSNPVEPASQR
ncbi:MAG: fumarylacetoacetate hydrolase family protein [Polyangiaceae bacterium]|nr:fumarylacetoacetate hydrolase family protein [Polyangiaceae bacterium]NUQ77731.1 fumarylacetoacetate hydrolase family protein [Polyangiaceae bacterium]